jgi:hypothetical protein
MQRQLTFKILRDSSMTFMYVFVRVLQIVGIECYSALFFDKKEFLLQTFLCRLANLKVSLPSCSLFVKSI